MATIRRFDDLGRISIPKTLREQVWGNPNMEGMQMDIIIQDDAVVIKKHKEADLVEVVRCHNCEYNGSKEKCPLLKMSPYRDDDRGYCSEGKRLE